MSRNPKDVAAQSERRVRLDLLEPVAEAQIARAMEFGAIDKGYGIRNFVAPGNDISLRCYLAAMRRHIDALLDGEDEAPDSGLHHLAHVGANVHVVLAAKAAGTLVDDRNPHALAEGKAALDAQIGGSTDLDEHLPFARVFAGY